MSAEGRSSKYHCHRGARKRSLIIMKIIAQQLPGWAATTHIEGPMTSSPTTQRTQSLMEVLARRRICQSYATSG